MGQKLRIAVWYNLPSGGAKRALHDHIQGLLDRGHHVECFRPPVPNADWLAMPCQEHEIPLKVYPDEKSYIKRIWKHVMRLTLGLSAMKKHSEEAAARIKAGQFDILFTNTCFHYYSPFIGRYCELPKVLYLQEPNRFLYEAIPYLPWVGVPDGSSWRRKLRGFFDYFAIRRQAQEELRNAKTYDRILVNSYFSRESVVRAYGLDSDVCYLGIDTERYKPSPSEVDNFVLGIGAIATPKRVSLAIEAVGCLPEPRPPLVWTANSVDEPYLAQLRDLAEKQGVKFDLRVLVSDDELVSLIRKAACVVYTPRLEPFGYVPLEAAACGTPVVTVAEGGLRETMTDGLGWIADPSPQGIAESLQQVLHHNKEAREQIAAKRHVIVDTWNLSAATDRLEKHLIEIANR